LLIVVLAMLVQGPEGALALYTRYLIIGDPPVLLGAVQVRTAFPLVAVSAKFWGVLGWLDSALTVVV